MLMDKRRKPLCPDTPEMAFGNMPNDGGRLLLTQEEADGIRQTDPMAAKYIRKFLGAEEFINNLPRYCLWLKDSTASDRKNSPEIQRRVRAVETMRLASTRTATQKLAEQPYLFGEDRQPVKAFLAIPKTSSERRTRIPIDFLPQEIIIATELFSIENATLYHFGILCSSFHNAWMRTVCGRLKSDYRYSNSIVYNNFPWPPMLNDKYKTAVATAAQAVLNARLAEEKRCTEQGQKCSLADLYSPANMPVDLVKAHASLDKAVDAAYGYKGGKDDAARVAFLFALYQALSSDPATSARTEPESAGIITASKKSEINGQED